MTQPIDKTSSTTDKRATKISRLWAPWRMQYILSNKKGECIFCKALKSDDKEGYILERTNYAFVMLNTFPYNNGHLMVAPKKHTGNIENLTGEEISDMMNLVQKSVAVLKKSMKPDGFNIGMNIGAVAGAGIVDHLHIHIVPRFKGDTNFMPVISSTKIISQALDETYRLLIKGFRK